MTHVRIGDPWWFPVLLGVLVWTALGLRRPAIFALALGRPVECPASETA